MRVVLVGMSNPRSADRRLALVPHPPNSAGHRLFLMLRKRVHCTHIEYREGFERRNLVSTTTWSQNIARRNAEHMIEEFQGRTVLLLGAAVRDAFGLPPVLVKPVVHRGVVFRQLPHPSGRCRWYNNPRHRRIAEMLLEELYEEGKR